MTFSKEEMSIFKEAEFPLESTVIILKKYVELEKKLSKILNLLIMDIIGNRSVHDDRRYNIRKVLLFYRREIQDYKPTLE